MSTVLKGVLVYLLLSFACVAKYVLVLVLVRTAWNILEVLS
jgi:hypothetical protein